MVWSMKKYTQQELDSIFEQHKLWLENQGGERAQLCNADLSHRVLQNIDLRCANLIRTNFSGSDLSGSNMSEADITYADFSHANLNNTIFRDADLRNTKMSYTQMLNVDLYRADLFRTDFSHANLSTGTFNRIDPSNTIIELRNPNQQCVAAE